MSTTEEVRNKKKQKMKENKKHPYKVGGSDRTIKRNKKGGVSDVLASISIFSFGLIIGTVFGRRIVNFIIELIRRLITNGFSRGL